MRQEKGLCVSQHNHKSNHRKCFLFLGKLTSYFFLHLTGTGSTNQSEVLIDLVGLDIESPSPPEHQPLPPSLSFPADLLSGSAPSAALSLLDEELLSLGNMQYKAV